MWPAVFFTYGGFFKMGSALPRFARAIKRPLEMQTRVEQALEGKPTVSPRHPSTQSAMDELTTRTQAQFLERESNDSAYLNLLREVRVDSVDPTPNVTGDRTEPPKIQRKLPQSRVWEPTQMGEIPLGKITEDKLSELFIHNMKNPDTWNVDKVSSHYKLDKGAVASVLKFYSEYAVIEKHDFPQPMENVSFLN